MKMKKILSKIKNTSKIVHLLWGLFVVFILLFIFVPGFLSSSVSYTAGILVQDEKKSKKSELPPLDKVLYDLKLPELANNLPMSGPAGSGTGIPTSSGNVGTPVPVPI